MRVPYKPDTRKAGDTRIRTFFAWFPTLMPDRSTVWLERVTVRENLIEWCYKSGAHARWEWRMIEEIRPPASRSGNIPQPNERKA